MCFVTKHIYKICVHIHIYVITGFLGGSVVKNLPVMQELQDTSVESLGWQYSLEEGMASHSSILAWRIPRTEETGGLQSIGLQNRA